MNVALQNYFNTLCCGGGCTCPPGYTKDVKTRLCVKEETMPPNVNELNVCLIPTSNIEYSKYGAWLYPAPFQQSSLMVTPSIVLDENAYWKASNTSTGAMNRCAVAIDKNCDGEIDALFAGSKTTIGFTYNNTGAQRTVYIGIGADNFFQLKVNGNTIADTSQISTSVEEERNYRAWHMIPVTLLPGTNYINAVGIGDGNTSDCIGLIIYDNTATELQNAADDEQLKILFTSASLRNTSYDIVSCQDGWILDTTGGVGNYLCRKTTTVPCGTTNP